MGVAGSVIRMEGGLPENSDSIPGRPADDRYVVSGGHQYDRRTMRGRESTIRHDDKAASRLAPKGDDRRFDLFVVMNGRSD
jgi:hypothetical protein